MKRIRTLTRRSTGLAPSIDAGRALAVTATIGLVLVVIVSLAVVGAVRASVVPPFDAQIVLDAQHRLVIHNGPFPPCMFISMPPQRDCAWPGSERHAFAVQYRTPNGARSLIWFQGAAP